MLSVRLRNATPRDSGRHRCRSGGAVSGQAGQVSRPSRCHPLGWGLSAPSLLYFCACRYLATLTCWVLCPFDGSGPDPGLEDVRWDSPADLDGASGPGDRVPRDELLHAVSHRIQARTAAGWAAVVMSRRVSCSLVRERGCRSPTRRTSVITREYRTSVRGRGDPLGGPLPDRPPRAVAAHCQDPALLELLAPGQDFHTDVATRVLGDRSRRDVAKKLNNSVNYGVGADTLHDTTGLPLQECLDYLAGMKERFPQWAQWTRNVADDARAGLLLNRLFADECGVSATRRVAG